MEINFRKIFGFAAILVLALSFVGCAAKPAEEPKEDNDSGAANETEWVEKSKWPSILVDVDEIVLKNLVEYKCNTGYDGETYFCVIVEFDFTHSQAVMAGLDDEVIRLTNSIYEVTGVKAAFFFYNSAGDTVLAVYDGADITNSLG